MLFVVVEHVSFVFCNTATASLRLQGAGGEHSREAEVGVQGRVGSSGAPLRRRRCRLVGKLGWMNGVASCLAGCRTGDTPPPATSTHSVQKSRTMNSQPAMVALQAASGRGGGACGDGRTWRMCQWQRPARPPACASGLRRRQLRGQPQSLQPCAHRCSGTLGGGWLPRTASGPSSECRCTAEARGRGVKALCTRFAACLAMQRG